MYSLDLWKITKEQNVEKKIPHSRSSHKLTHTHQYVAGDLRFVWLSSIIFLRVVFRLVTFSSYPVLSKTQSWGHRNVAASQAFVTRWNGFLLILYSGFDLEC